MEMKKVFSTRSCGQEQVVSGREEGVPGTGSASFHLLAALVSGGGLVACFQGLESSSNHPCERVACFGFGLHVQPLVPLRKDSS